MNSAEHLIALNQDGTGTQSSVSSPGDVRGMKASIPDEAEAIVHTHPASGKPTPSAQDYVTATKMGKPNFVLSQNAIYVAMPGMDPNTTQHIKVADVSPAKHGKLNVKWNQ